MSIIYQIPNYITNLILSNGTDTEHDINIATGFCMASDNLLGIQLSSILTKQIDVNWAEGTDDGGFPSGLSIAADTWYHVFVISKLDGSVDAGFDSALNASNLLADTTGYTKYRRIGSVLTDGSSNIHQFTDIEIGGGSVHREWSKYFVEASALAATARTLLTVTSPINSIAYIIGALSSGTTVFFWMKSTSFVDIAPSAANGYDGQANTGGWTAVVDSQIPVDSSNQIAVRCSAGNIGNIYCYGYLDNRL